MCTLATLERLVASKGVASAETQGRYRDLALRCASHAHGKPVELSPASSRETGIRESMSVERRLSGNGTVLSFYRLRST